MNKQSNFSSNIEQKLNAVYAVNPADDFINRLEKDLFVRKHQEAKLPAWRLWINHLRQGRGWYRLALASTVVLVLAALLLATPRGRAWAQEILHFFTRAGSDTQPIVPLSETSTPDSGYSFTLTVAEAGGQAGFDPLEPSWLPEILAYSGASYQPEQNIVRIFYRYNRDQEDTTNGLVLTEEPFQGNEDCEICSLVGASAVVETVQIGDVTGEYFVGVWQAIDDTGVWGWVSDPYLQQLRWQANGLAFELLYMGLPESVTKADLIAIAESMR